jgi:hypothetical protein
MDFLPANVYILDSGCHQIKRGRPFFVKKDISPAPGRRRAAMSFEKNRVPDMARRLIREGVSASVLKHAAVITMLIDHITCCFLEVVYINGVPLCRTGRLFY